ncbi:MAG: hypothetical protein EA402_11285 [Planctomycetota bacterium]|nr:MAG: hypothetical protein EA402_11285 [Planctomycetota bacterium]
MRLRGACLRLPVTEPTSLIESIFWDCLGHKHYTRLEGGAAEPEYFPADTAASRPARIVYRQNFIASAFHEVAHWCIAGAQRRKQADFGYWYEGDGRDQQAQGRFLQVEVRPQAVESFFHAAWGSTFHPSLDNLHGPAGDVRAFAQAIADERQRLQRQCLPPRAAIFAQALANAPQGDSKP